MGYRRIIALIFTLIIFAFLHVFFQTEIIKMGYQTKENEDIFQELIENNHVLKYNIYALESPYSLGRYILTKNSNLKLMEPFQVLSLKQGPSKESSNKNKEIISLFDNYIFLSLRKFFTGKQAEAETIK